MSFEPDWRNRPGMRLYRAWLFVYFRVIPRPARPPVAWVWRKIEDRNL